MILGTCFEIVFVRGVTAAQLRDACADAWQRITTCDTYHHHTFEETGGGLLRVTVVFSTRDSRTLHRARNALQTLVLDPAMRVDRFLVLECSLDGVDK